MVGPVAALHQRRPATSAASSGRDIEGLLDTMDKNYIGWANFLAPVIMKNADRPELGAELTRASARPIPSIARRFAEATFFSDNRADLAGSPCRR